MLGRLRSPTPAERPDESFFLFFGVGCQRVERGDVATELMAKSKIGGEGGAGNHRESQTPFVSSRQELASWSCARSAATDDCESMLRESARCSCRHSGQRRAASRRGCQGAALGGCDALRARRYFHSPRQGHRGLKPRTQSK